MTEAQEAISELLSAFDEYGSTFTLQEVVKGVYDPANGSTSDTVTDITMNGVFSSSASESVSRSIMNNEASSGYEFSIVLYHTETPTTAWKVVYKGITYKIVHVATYTLQNTIYKYEVLIKR